MKQKLLVIANPFSGTNAKSNLEKNLQRLNEGQFEMDVVFTQHAGHACDLALNGIQNGFDIVAAAGGDGTVNEVASVLAGTQTQLGILPSGSGNGFAMHLGLGRDAIKAFEILKHGQSIWVDTCKVNDKFFINVSGLGFDARVAYLTKYNKQRGFIPYLTTSLKEIRHFAPLNLELTWDEGTINGNFAAAIVANASMYGYNFTIAPTAALDDGLMDVILLKEAPVYKYLLASYRMLTKTIHQSPLVTSFRTSSLQIKIHKQDYFHVDGEGFIMDKDLTFSLQKKNIKVIANAQKG
ncbi:MAG: diacylglycerol kinase family protein [Saprospiraceae bacterium]|nr:diacylglycerol kinase family lipid kinase [Saprospiraceae bacterium]